MSTPEQDAFLQSVLGVNPALLARADPGSSVAGAGQQRAKTNNSPPITQGFPRRNDPNAPKLDDQQFIEAQVEKEIFDNTFDAALQGTSAKSSDPDKASEAARDIAEEATKTNSQRVKDLTDVNVQLNTYKRCFADTIQSLAAGNDSPSAIVKKAHAIALKAVNVDQKEIERMEWQNATLPQPMAPDCEIVHGKVPGPKNHVLCKTHGHIVDTAAKMVIAHSLDEYKAQQH
jgi:hypothetical protein